MEDAVSTTGTRAAPFEGRQVPFSQIGSALAQAACQDTGAMRALVATLVAVGPPERLDEVARIVHALGEAGTVRGILISEGDEAAPPVRVSGNTVALRGLKAPYVNNAVAALRLSSLPTLVWWRGGRGETLDEVVHLADRIVLDEQDPESTWRRAVTLFDHTAISDLRWAHLTQWRALMAHFFDIPEVRSAVSEFTHLHISGADTMSARLFAAWLTSSLPFQQTFTVDITPGQRTDPIQAIELGDHDQRLTLRLAAPTCLETAVSVRGHRGATRIVGRTNHSPDAILTEELRIRARDVAFERALRALVSS